MSAIIRMSFTRLISFLAIAALTLLAACTDTGSPATALSTVPAAPIAFEPVTGMPDTRAAELAAALGQRATTHNLTVVSRDDPKVVYRVKGYFAAQPSAERTTVSYIWDVFDKAGERVHRFDGTQQVNAGGASDPWGGVTPEALDGIADATASELARFLTTVNQQAASTTGSVNGQTSALSFASRSKPALPARPRYYVGAINTDISDGATALPKSLARALSEHGALLAASPADADIIVSAETSIAPPEKGRQMVAIVWTAERADGSGLGSVRQVSRILENTLDHGWGPAADKAADRAGPALIELTTTGS